MALSILSKGLLFTLYILLTDFVWLRKYYPSYEPWENPNKAKIIAHLAKNRGETAEDIGKHLGYPLPTVYKYLRELEGAQIIESEAKGNTRIYSAGDFKL